MSAAVANIATSSAPAPSRRTSIPHVAALDGLRGAAVAGVLLFHGGRLRGGYLGVDAFFVLSGYLITSLLVAEWGSKGGVNLGNFWARRARRLLPALFLMLLGVAVYCVVWAKPTELERIRSDAMATLLYVANWHTIFSDRSYWDLFSAPSPLEHAWSLAIEEQFYLLWPLVAVFVLRWRRASTERGVATLGIVAITVSIISAALLVFAYGNENQSRAYLGTDTRVAAILLGAALACLQRRVGHPTGRAPRVALEVAGVGAALYLVWAWTQLGGNDDFLYEGGLFFAGVAVTIIIAAITNPERGPLAWILAFAPLCWLGLISYGVYLWHWPVYRVLTPGRTGMSGIALLTLRILVSIAIAIVSFVLVERPIRRGTLAPRKLLIGAPIAFAAVVVAMLLTTANAASPPTVGPSGLATDVPKDASGKSAIRTELTWTAGEQVGPLTNTCRDGVVPDPLPPAAKDTPKTKVMIVGDSVACFIGASFELHQGELGISALNRSIVGCPFVRADNDGEIRYDNGKIDDQLRACGRRWADDLDAFDPDVVIAVFGYPGLYDWKVEGAFRRPCDGTFDDWWRRGALANYEMLASRGAVVTQTSVVHPPPLVDDFLPEEQVARLGRETDCLNEQIRSATATGDAATLLDLDQYVCPDGECRDRIDGVELRTDPVHFTGEAADIVTKWLMPRAQDALDARTDAPSD